MRSLNANNNSCQALERILKLQQQEFKPGGHGLEDGGVRVQVDW